MLMRKHCSALRLEVHYSHSSYTLTLRNWKKVKFLHYGKFHLMQAFANRFQHILHWCRSHYKTTDCSANTFNQKCHRLHLMIFTQDQPAASSTVFWKGDFSTLTHTPCPSNLLLLMQCKPKEHTEYLWSYCCCSFQLPTSFPVFQDGETLQLIPAESYLQLFTGCSSPPLLQCAVPIRAAQPKQPQTKITLPQRFLHGRAISG